MPKRFTKTISCLATNEDPEQTRLRHECVARLAKKITVESLIDPMAGEGKDAERFMAPVTWVNDVDEECRDRLRILWPHTTTSYDFFNETERADLLSLCKPDLVFWDPNTFTLPKWDADDYRAELDDCFRAAQKFLILNDCSYFSCRMGWQRKTYSRILGTPIRSADDYLAALPAFFKKHYPDWDLTDKETYFHPSPKGNGGTTYLLFRRASR